MESLVDRYGRPLIARVVTDFYAAVLKSPHLNRYFATASVGALVEHQTNFMMAIMGGPSAFSDEHIRDTHQHLGVTAEDFDELIGLLVKTMEAHEIAAEDAAGVSAGYRRLRDEVVSSG